MIHPKLDRVTFLFISFLVLSTAVVLLVAGEGLDKFFGKTNQSKDSFVSFTTNFGISYKRSIQRIFNYYLLERSKVDVSKEEAREPWLALLANIREKLLALKTVSEWQNKHLLLILDIDGMRQELISNNLEKARSSEVELIARFNQI